MRMHLKSVLISEEQKMGYRVPDVIGVSKVTRSITIMTVLF